MLRSARRRAGLSQRDLAERAGVPQSTIGRIETGVLDPRATTLDRLLRACGEELRAAPRRGAGVDRSLIRAMLALTPVERIEAMVSASADLGRLRRRTRR